MNNKFEIWCIRGGMFLFLFDGIDKYFILNFRIWNFKKKFYFEWYYREDIYLLWNNLFLIFYLKNINKIICKIY